MIVSTTSHVAVVVLAVACLGLAGCGASSDPSAEQEEPVPGESQDEPAAKTVTGQLSGFDCAVVGEL